MNFSNLNWADQSLNVRGFQARLLVEDMTGSYFLEEAKDPYSDDDHLDKHNMALPPCYFSNQDVLLMELQKVTGLNPEQIYEAYENLHERDVGILEGEMQDCFHMAADADRKWESYKTEHNFAYVSVVYQLLEDDGPIHEFYYKHLETMSQLYQGDQL